MHVEGLARSTSRPKGHTTQAFSTQGRARDFLRIIGSDLAGGKGRNFAVQSGGRFEVGAKVSVNGLSGRMDLNGKIGSIKAFNQTSMRYTVELALGAEMEKVAIKEANLELIIVSASPYIHTYLLLCALYRLSFVPSSHALTVLCHDRVRQDRK
jgi:hypothetical protein